MLPLKNPEAYASIQMNPVDNAANLPATYLAELQALPARERLRFWEGRFGSIGENALWTFEGIETYRKSVRPDLRRIIIAVDPSGTKGTDDGDLVGIVVVGLGLDGNAYVLEDCSVKAPPAVWGRVVVNAFDRHAADCIVADQFRRRHGRSGGAGRRYRRQGARALQGGAGFPRQGGAR